MDNNDKYYKDGLKKSISAILASKTRHRFQKMAAQQPANIRYKYKKVQNDLSKMKHDDMAEVIQDSNKTEKISVDIRSDPKIKNRDLKSVTADFDNYGHMNLHLSQQKLGRPLADQEGRAQSTGTGENNKFYKKVTGEPLEKDVDHYTELLKQKYNLKEERMNILEDEGFKKLDGYADSPEGKYNKYLRDHITNVQKSFEILKRRVPELFKNLEIPMDELEDNLKKHDASKYSKEEFQPYVEHFYGNNGGKQETKSPEYEAAWKHHYMHNPHHPEYWGKSQRMPESCFIEMICDWMSFSIKTKEMDELFKYWDKPETRADKEQFMHPDTIKELNAALKLIKSKNIDLKKELD